MIDINQTLHRVNNPTERVCWGHYRISFFHFASRNPETLESLRIAEVFAMLTSDFRPVVEIWPFRARALKNMHYNPYLWRNRLNSRIMDEIEDKEIKSG